MKEKLFFFLFIFAAIRLLSSCDDAPWLSKPRTRIFCG